MASRDDDTGAASAGSQLQAQLYVNRRREQLDGALRQAFPELAGATFEWRSPLAEDGFAEYFGTSFLKRLGLEDHADALKQFWPARGPQWDALALVHRPGGGRPGVLLVEGKSYPAEMLKGSSAASAADSDNRKLIEASLTWTRQQMGLDGALPESWTGPLYQNANRLAHLYWLRDRGVDAWLVHLLFTGDPHGPTTENDWHAALEQAGEKLGLTGLTMPSVGHVLLPAGDREELVG